MRQISGLSWPCGLLAISGRTDGETVVSDMTAAARVVSRQRQTVAWMKDGLVLLWGKLDTPIKLRLIIDKLGEILQVLHIFGPLRRGVID